MFDADIFISRKLIHDIDEAKDQLEEIEEEIKQTREELFMIAAATPNSSVDSDSDDPLLSLEFKMRQALERYEELLYDKHLIELLIDKFEEDEKFKPILDE